jgi:hypothetical protein
MQSTTIASIELRAFAAGASLVLLFAAAGEDTVTLCAGDEATFELVLLLALDNAVGGGELELYTYGSVVVVA